MAVAAQAVEEQRRKLQATTSMVKEARDWKGLRGRRSREEAIDVSEVFAD